MPPTHNSSSEVELEFCKRIIRNGLKQQKCQAYYTITRSGTAYFIRSGLRQFLTGTAHTTNPRSPPLVGGAGGWDILHTRCYV